MLLFPLAGIAAPLGTQTSFVRVMRMSTRKDFNVNSFAYILPIHDLTERTALN
jgi:hypothetical protein